MIGDLMQLDDRSITMECRPNAFTDVPGECLLEAMAQVAAVWMASSSGKDNVNRSGLLVVVQKCELLKPVLRAGDPLVASVTSMSEAREGLLMFNGACRDEQEELVMSATFSILVPPLDNSHKTIDG